MGYSQKECVQNVRSSLALFKSLGFVVCPTKSVLIPSHKITYLGFEIDSQSMTVASTSLERKQNIEYNLQIAVWELVYCKGVSAVHRAGRFMFSGSESEIRTALASQNHLYRVWNRLSEYDSCTNPREKTGNTEYSLRNSCGLVQSHHCTLCLYSRGWSSEQVLEY